MIIRNKRTGETKEIKVADAPSYAIQPNLPGKSNRAIQNPVGNFFLGRAADLFKDLGTKLGFDQSGLQQSQDTATQMAQRAAQRAQTEQDPTQRANLMKVSNDALQTVSGNAQQQANAYTPSVTGNPLVRAGLAASDIAGTAATISSLPSIAKNVYKAGKAGIHAAVNPLETLGKLRTAAIGNRTIPAGLADQSIEDIMKQGKYYLASPQNVQNVAGQRLRTLQSMLSPQATEQGMGYSINDIYEMLNSLESVAKPYDKADALAQGTRLVSGAVRNYVTPQLSKTAQALNKAMSLGYSLQPKLPWLAGGATGFGILDALYNAIKGRNSSYGN